MRNLLTAKNRELRSALRIVAATGYFLMIYLLVSWGLTTIHIGAWPLVNLLTHNPKLGGRPTAHRFRVVENSKDVDILFVGTSRCFTGFDAEVILNECDKVAITIASNTQSLLNSYYLLRQYLSRVDPDLVILEVHLGALSIDGMESLYELIQTIPPSFDMLKMAFATRNPHAINNTVCATLHRVHEPIRPKNFHGKIRSQSVLGGFIANPDVLDVSFADKHTHTPRYYATVDNKQIRYLKRILRYVKQNGHDIVLVTQPESEIDDSNFANREEIAELIRKTAEETDVLFYDFNTLDGIVDSKTDFYNTSHLNTFGAKKLTKTLIKEVLIDYFKQKDDTCHTAHWVKRLNHITYSSSMPSRTVASENGVAIEIQRGYPVMTGGSGSLRHPPEANSGELSNVMLASKFYRLVLTLSDVPDSLTLGASIYMYGSSGGYETRSMSVENGVNSLVFLTHPEFQHGRIVIEAVEGKGTVTVSSTQLYELSETSGYDKNTN